MLAVAGRILKLPPDAFLDRAALIVTWVYVAHKCLVASSARVRGIEVILK